MTRILVESGAEANMLVVVPPARDAATAAGEALTAFARSVALEHPRIRIHVAIVDEPAPAGLLRELQSDDVEVSFAGGERYVRRIEEVVLSGGTASLRRGAVVLITGGLAVPAVSLRTTWRLGTVVRS